MPSSKSLEEQIETLIDQAYADLDDLDAKAARRKGQKLIKMRHTSGFEIVARSYQLEGELDQAIAIARQGTEVAPQVWLLWLHLGSLLSDASQFDEAATAYRRALECDGAHLATIQYNQAVLLSRQGQDEEALRILQASESEACEDEELWLLHASVKVSVLGDLERWSEAEAEAREALGKVRGPDLESQADAVGQIHASLAKVLWCGLKRREEALSQAWEALDLVDVESSALWVIRNIEGRRSPGARRFRLTVRGSWDEPIADNEVIPQFFRHYEVVADSLDEALALVSPFEPEAVRASLSLEKSHDDGAAPDQPGGVYYRSGYIFFTGED